MGRGYSIKKELAVYLLLAAIAVTTTYVKVDSLKKPDCTSTSRDRTSDSRVYIDDGQVALASMEYTSDDLKKLAYDEFTAMNKIRTDNGLDEYTWNTQLESAASIRSVECVTNWSHTRPNGSPWWTVCSDYDYGENLAKNFSTVDEVNAGWMGSETHKANILSKDFKSVAVWVYEDASGNMYWAQEFGY